MTVADQVALARAVSKVAHAGQKRKGGEDFFNHPQRVAKKVGRLGAEAVIIAYLHDVIEDTVVSEETIYQLFGPQIAWNVEALTRDTATGETYTEFVFRTALAGSDTALQVKLADLHDNMTDPHKVIKGDRYARADAKIRAELERRGVTPLVFA